MKGDVKVLLIITMATLLGLAIGLFINNQTSKIKSNLITSLGTDLKVWKDKNSLSHAKIQVLETASAKEFTRLATNDSLVVELQDLVKGFSKELKRRGSATIIKTITQIDTVFVTKDSLIYDDVSNSYSIPLPYSKSFANKWLNLDYNITTDSTSYSLLLQNDYSIVIGEERETLFKPRVPYVEIINKNPYTSTEALRTYQVTVPKKKIGIGPQIGYGLSGSLQIQPYIGIGIHYDIIRF
jgi:hypothetical protein